MSIWLCSLNKTRSRSKESFRRSASWRKEFNRESKGLICTWEAPTEIGSRTKRTGRLSETKSVVKRAALFEAIAEEPDNDGSGEVIQAQIIKRYLRRHIITQ